MDITIKHLRSYHCGIYLLHSLFTKDGLRNLPLPYLPLPWRRKSILVVDDIIRKSAKTTRRKHVVIVRRLTGARQLKIYKWWVCGVCRVRWVEQFEGCIMSISSKRCLRHTVVSKMNACLGGWGFKSRDFWVTHFKNLVMNSLSVRYVWVSLTWLTWIRW